MKNLSALGVMPCIDEPASKHFRMESMKRANPAAW
jgi:hypothetical protein